MNDAQGLEELHLYWAKAQPAAPGAASDHHTIVGHSLDVAASAFVVVDGSRIVSAKLAKALGVPVNVVAHVVATFCALHDIGKIDTRFQRKAPDVADRLRPATSGIPALSFDHGTEGFRLLEDDPASQDQLAEHLGPHALVLLRAVTGHHGSLPTRDEPATSRLPRAIRAEDAAARRHFIDGVVQFFGSLGTPLPWTGEATGAAVQLVAGVCAVADWIGSNVDYFPYHAGPISDVGAYWSASLQRGERAARDAGLLRSGVTSAGFCDLFPGYQPRDVQELTEQVDVGTPALVVVEAEMGRGKTEAALSLASRFLAAGAGDGVMFALPTMATSNAMLTRVLDVAPRMFDATVNVALAHGQAARNRGFQAVVAGQFRDEDAEEASVACARWLLHRKRVLLAQVGVGTVDQALQAAISVRHQFVRMFGLARNVVVIDEVHAYDAYMEVLLEHLLSWLGALDVPVVVLSATLPSGRRAALARAWLGSRAGTTEAPSDEFARAVAQPYPLVTVTTRAGTTTLCAGTAASARRHVELEYVARSGTARDQQLAVAERLVAAARDGARVVWIRNTVGEAQDAFRQLDELAPASVERTLFHARFRGCDRAAIEERVLTRFGRNAPDGGRILVATQVVEQSLDLDFDEMHVDLAPIDLVFQRSGRLHRHRRDRPAGFETPRLVVHGPRDDEGRIDFGPSQYVYDEGTLWIARALLRARDRLVLPDDLRPLVEETYHPTARAMHLERAGLLDAERTLEATLEARRTKARRCCIEATTAEPDGDATLDDDDDAVGAFTRDGKSATLLPVRWDGSRAYPLDDGSAALSCDLSEEASWRSASDLLGQTLSIPARATIEPVETGSFATWLAAFRRWADRSGLGANVVPIPLRHEGTALRGRIRVGTREQFVRYDSVLGFVKERRDEEATR